MLKNVNVNNKDSITRGNDLRGSYLHNAPFRHPLLNNVIGNILPSLLVLTDQCLKGCHELRLDSSGAPELTAAGPILFPDPLQLRIVLKKESQPLVRNINLEVGSMLLLQFFGFLSTRKGIFLDLPFDFTGSIGKKNCRVGVTTGHFALSALQWGEEFRVNECRLAIQRVTFGGQLMSNITGHAEVWVLVDGTWNQTGHVGIAAGPEHKRERRGEGRGGLNRWERNFPNVGSSVKSKDSIDFWYRAQCDERKED